MILITGANSRTGNCLVKKLVQKRQKVRAFLRKNSDDFSIKGLNVEKVYGDVLDSDSLNTACKGVEVVFHLAAMINLTKTDEDMTMKVNYEGTKNLINACLKNNVKKLIYISTIHSFKEPPKGSVLDEKCPFDPESPRGIYDRSKALASIAVQEASRKGLYAVIVCPTGIIGPYDYVPSYFGQSLIDYIKGKNRQGIEGAYDYVDVRDVIDGMLSAGEKGKNGEVYILSGEQMSMKQFYQYIQDFTGIQAPKKLIPYKIVFLLAVIISFFNKKSTLLYSINTLNSNSFISHQKATQELGYNPMSVKDSLRDQIEWFKKQKMI